MSTSSWRLATASLASGNVTAASWSSAHPPMMSAGCLSSVVVLELALSGDGNGADSSFVSRCLMCREGWLLAEDNGEVGVVVCW